MIRLAILVEGQTEEKFVKQLLFVHFLKKNISVTPIILTTRREPTESNHKGGMVSFSKVKKELLQLLRSFDFVTTMFDYYGLKNDFPEYEESKNILNVYEKAEMVESALAKEINPTKFIPYFQMYEFEALLFSSIKGFKSNYNSSSGNAQIQKIIANFPNPEKINDNKETAPSKRIERAYGENQFMKTSDGIIIAKKIGLETIRNKCKHFNEWITKIENLVEK